MIYYNEGGSFVGSFVRSFVCSFVRVRFRLREENGSPLALSKQTRPWMESQMSFTSFV
jgi:hypothetical protein